MDDLAKIETYELPPTSPASGPDFDAARSRSELLSQTYFCLEYCGSIFERLIALRRFENVHIDILEDVPAIDRLADMITQLKNQDGRSHVP